MASAGSGGDWLRAGAGEDKLSHTVTHCTEPRPYHRAGAGLLGTEGTGAGTDLCCLSAEGSQRGSGGFAAPLIYSKSLCRFLQWLRGALREGLSGPASATQQNISVGEGLSETRAFCT